MAKTLAPSVTTRDQKGLKFLSIVEAAYNKARLSEEEAQRVNDTPGLAELVANFIAKAKQFADEKVSSSYTYPKGYRVKGITEQTNILHELFPGIGYADEKLTEQPVPVGAEGWFAIPRWEKFAATYNGAVKLVLGKIAETRKFTNYREGQLGPNQLRQYERTVAMFKKLGNQQAGHDILVVAAQFGLRHRGRSVRRVRAVFNASEFGLGAYEAGIMLLTHPERLVSYDDLWIDCAGDEYDYPGVDGRFDRAPFFFFFGGGWVGFDTDWVDRASGGCGAASGFAPQ